MGTGLERSRPISARALSWAPVGVKGRPAAYAAADPTPGSRGMPSLDPALSIGDEDVDGFLAAFAAALEDG